MYPDRQVGVYTLTVGYSVTVLKVLQAVNVMVCAGILAGLMTVAGIGEPLLSVVPGMVEATILVPGITVVPEVYPGIQVGVD